MVGVVARLASRQRQELLDDVNYLNLQEIRLLCERCAIPYRILVETPDGQTRSTQDTDRKPVILDRIRRFLATGEVPAATRLPARIVRPAGPPALLKPTDRLYYRWYNKTYDQVIALLKELTDGRFRNGAVARVLIMEFWTSGRAPTFREFARAWESAVSEPRELLTAEYAFLTDLRRGQAGPGWKRTRQHRAERALATIDHLLA